MVIMMVATMAKVTATLMVIDNGDGKSDCGNVMSVALRVRMTMTSTWYS